VEVAAPYVAGRPPVVRRLHVREGDMVRKGQLLAELDSRAEMEAALQQSIARATVARSRLEQVKAGPKTSDTAVKEAEIAEIDARLEQARDELQRFEKLRQTDDVTSSELSQKQSAVRVLEHAAAWNRLRGLSGGYDKAMSSSRRLSSPPLPPMSSGRAGPWSRRWCTRRERARPQDAAKTGEQAGPQGLVELGESDSMYAVAEVYESDIGRVRVGQRTIISGDLLWQPVSGAVERIATEVSKLSALPR